MFVVVVVEGGSEFGLRFVLSSGEEGEGETAGELKRRILENYHETFPIMQRIEEKRVKLRLRDTDFYLTDKVQWKKVRKSEGEYAEILMEVERQATEVVSSRETAEKGCQTEETSDAKLKVEKAVQGKSEEAAVGVFMDERMPELVQLQEEEEDEEEDEIARELHEQRGRATVVLDEEGWKYKTAKGKEKVVEGFRRWVSTRGGEIWSVGWRRELVMKSLQLDQRFVEEVVRGLESGELKIYPVDSGVLELLKILRDSGSRTEGVLRVMERLVRDSETRKFLVKYSGGLVNFLCSALKDGSTELLAAKCIRECAYEFEFRHKLRLNAHVHMYLNESKSPEARRLILLALENSHACVVHIKQKHKKTRIFHFPDLQKHSNVPV